MKRCFFTAVVVAFSFLAKGQTFRYSDEAEKSSYNDVIQLVANVGDNHHLIRFPVNGQPRVSIFNHRLKLLSAVPIDQKVKENTDIRIIPFPAFYFLYLHTAGSPEHQLWRINGNGDQTSVSDALRDVLSSELGGSTATLQLLRQKEKLFLVAHNYYDSLERVVSTVVQLDENLQVINTRKVAFPFFKRENRLQQVDLLGEALLVLKTTRSLEAGNLLQLLKIDLNTGELQEKIFNSGSSFFLNPALQFASSDSSLLVHAVVKSAPSSQMNQTALFVCRLDQALEEKTPVRTIRLRITGTVQEDYFWVQGATPQWLEVKTYVRPQVIYQQRTLLSGWSRGPASDGLPSHYAMPPGFGTFRPQAMNIRFTLLSDKLQKTSDSLMNGVNDKVEFVPFANTTFRLRNKAYALLAQNFPRNNHALLLVSVDKDGALRTTDLSVYSKYDYQLSALQPVAADNSFLVPYLHKRRLGLVKILMNE